MKACTRVLCVLRLLHLLLACPSTTASLSPLTIVILLHKARLGTRCALSHLLCDFCSWSDWDKNRGGGRCNDWWTYNGGAGQRQGAVEGNDPGGCCVCLWQGHVLSGLCYLLLMGCSFSTDYLPSNRLVVGALPTGRHPTHRAAQQATAGSRLPGRREAGRWTPCTTAAHCLP